MKPIVTLTLNPCIDSAAEAERVRPVHKIRTSNERYYPGGGGVNVARVLVELGAPALPVYLAGGATGALLDQLMTERGFAPRAVRIRDNTRISHAIYERATGLEYRFVPEGPVLEPGDWPRCRTLIEGLDFDWLVASGSLPRGAPVDCYADLARLCAARGARFVLDSSGPALAAAIDGGPVHLVKPSLGEFRTLTGAPLETPASVDAAAAALRGRGVELVAVTLGQDGALLANAEGVVRRLPPPVEARSATGAGDSFLGGFVFGLAEGRPPRDAFAVAMAAGAASVLTPGTELCRREDVLRLLAGAG